MKNIQKIFERFNEKFKNLAYASWFGISNPWGSSSFTTVDGTISKVQTALNFFINISGLVAVVVIIYGAYLMIIAAGDDGKIEQGINTIQAGIIGLVIVFVAGAGIQWLVREVLKM